MYSPFSDSKGRPLTIEKVKFSHLSQLVDCDEGHHVEYKLLLEDGGKAIGDIRVAIFPMRWL